MGCAIGMTIAAACEIFYWITLKPLVKFLASRTDSNEITNQKFKYVYKTAFFIAFSILFVFAYDRFYNVYLAFKNRNHY